MSPEEIRHLSLSRSVHGYDRDEVDEALAEIADSFEAVWHQRTTLYADVRQLQEELRQQELAHGNHQQDELERARVERTAMLAELKRAQVQLRELQAAGERFDAEQDQRREEEEHAAAELARLEGEAERLRSERDRLLQEAKRWTAVIAEERRKLSDFLLKALDQVERVSPNGSATAGLSELRELREKLREGGPEMSEPIFEVRKVRGSNDSSS